MKINQLIGEFSIATSNEEKDVLEKIDQVTPLISFTEREQFVIETLIRKSLVSKVVKDNTVLVVQNELKTT